MKGDDCDQVIEKQSYWPPGAHSESTVIVYLAEKSTFVLTAFIVRIGIYWSLDVLGPDIHVTVVGHIAWSRQVGFALSLWANCSQYLSDFVQIFVGCEMCWLTGLAQPFRISTGGGCGRPVVRAENSFSIQIVLAPETDWL